MGDHLKITKNPSTRTGENLNNEVGQFIDKNKKVFCKALNRRAVSLTKYLERTQNRRDATRRKQVFSACIELIRKAKPENVRRHERRENQNHSVEISFEIMGISANGEKIGVHIREEEDRHGNRVLYLTSTIRAKT